MPYLVIGLVAAIGIMFMHSVDAIPVASVGGPMVIAFVTFIAVFAVAIVEAWERGRGVLGWIVNFVVVFFGVLLIAPFGGTVIVLLLSPFMSGSGSLAAEGGSLMSISLALMMGVAIATAWGSLWVVNRWRERSVSAGGST